MIDWDMELHDARSPDPKVRHGAIVRCGGALEDHLKDSGLWGHAAALIPADKRPSLAWVLSICFDNRWLDPGRFGNWRSQVSKSIKERNKCAHSAKYAPAIADAIKAVKNFRQVCADVDSLYGYAASPGRHVDPVASHRALERDDEGERREFEARRERERARWEAERVARQLQADESQRREAERQAFLVAERERNAQWEAESLRRYEAQQEQEQFRQTAFRLLGARSSTLRFICSFLGLCLIFTWARGILIPIMLGVAYAYAFPYDATYGIRTSYQLYLLLSFPAVCVALWAANVAFVVLSNQSTFFELGAFPQTAKRWFTMTPLLFIGCALPMGVGYVLGLVVGFPVSAIALVSNYTRREIQAFCEGLGTFVGAGAALYFTCMMIWEDTSTTWRLRGDRSK